MSMRPINVCWGTGCDFVLQCKSSDANQPTFKPYGAWLRHYYPQSTGENCLDYDPMTPSDHVRRQWGHGAEAND